VQKNVVAEQKKIVVAEQKNHVDDSRSRQYDDDMMKISKNPTTKWICAPVCV